MDAQILEEKQFLSYKD